MQLVFVDTDVLIDFLTNREPFSSFAAELFSLAEQKEISIYITSLSFSNAYYVLRKFGTHEKIISKLKEIRLLTKLLEVNKTSVDLALASNFNDFEDALQYYSVIQHGKITTILTKNTKDYRHSDFPVLTPETYLKSRNT
ncbi:MAG: DNA-binding protein [Bacteroidetes bacterium HGW-Bacteroidetes-12]|nr:MAG: DNA-binding protein [Bacteroidetes bacterium HGW-Bacteroidetes-12]